MAGYSNVPRSTRYGFLGSRPSTMPALSSDGGTGPASSYFSDGNGKSYLMTEETTIQRVPPSAFTARSYEVALDQGQMSSSPTSDMPTVVEEFLKKIQTEVSQPSWPPAVSQSPFGFPHPTPVVQFGPTTQVDFGEFTNVMPRPITELGFIWRGRMMAAPIRTAPAQQRPNGKISKAMNDISEATEYLKEFARPPAPNTDTVTAPRNPVPSPAAVNKDSTLVTIDSQEAARRCKNIIVSTEPSGKEGSVPLLDSKAAKDKYGGVFV